MILLFLTVLLLFSGLGSLTEGNSTGSPRMIFTDKEITMKKLPLLDHDAPLWIVPEGEPHTVTVAGQKHLMSFDLRAPQKPPVKKIMWKECIGKGPDCNYNITVVHKREEANQMFVCGTDGMETTCCDVDLSQQSPMCISTEKMEKIRGSIKEFVLKDGEPSALVESAESADLYITYSGSQEYVGIHKFGRNKVGPANQNKEQHYVGLMLSRRGEDHGQDRVYAFYKEKNRDTSLYSEMWLPFVTQVCMADTGGPKNTLQFSWTSQLNARLFCGDSDTKQYFSELIDVAFVHADRWQETQVYALFRNEWNMSAVCVYTIHDIDNIFRTSPFKGNNGDRPRRCVPDSTTIHLDILRKVEKTTEMEQWIWPVDKSGPLLFNHHSYTHIYVDSSQQKRNSHHPVLFLSLNSGGIHKVIKNINHTLVIAEYRPFNRTTDILSIVLHTSSRKLYVNSRSELVQLDVENCAQYGDRCEDCVLARDPYCSWNGIRCTAEASGTVQDVARGDHTICKQHTGIVSRYSTNTQVDEEMSTRLPSEAKYFLQCPVSSHHAHYTWRHHKKSTPCSSRERQCLFLIDSMGRQQEGTYTCVSEEMGYSKVLAQYRLQLESRAVGRSSRLLVWVCLMAVLIKSLSC